MYWLQVTFDNPVVDNFGILVAGAPPPLPDFSLFIIRILQKVWFSRFFLPPPSPSACLSGIRTPPQIITFIITNILGEDDGLSFVMHIIEGTCTTVCLIIVWIYHKVILSLSLSLRELWLTFSCSPKVWKSTNNSTIQNNSLIIISHQLKKKASNRFKVRLYLYASHPPLLRFIVVVKELVCIGETFLEFCL